jgi:hypothetical protein
MPHDDEPDTGHLWQQVDQAFADVRRSESTGPAATLAILVSGLPMLLLAIATLLRLLS